MTVVTWPEHEALAQAAEAGGRAEEARTSGVSASGSTQKPAGSRVAMPSPPADPPSAPRHPVLIAMSVVGVLVLLATVGAAGLLLYGNSQIERADIAGIIPLAEDGSPDQYGDGASMLATSGGVPGRRYNVLIVGSDSREVLTSEDRREVAAGAIDGQRADTIMLVTVDTGTSRAAVMSFPRDLLVERCDGTEGKINGAYAIGQDAGGQGGSCLVQTVTQLTGVPINHYIEVDFHGFLQVVDTVGGVRMWLDQPLSDPKAKLALPAGCITLTGPQALAFVRSRQDSDFGRIARQQRFLREVANELVSAGTLTNIPQLIPLVDRAASAVRTDAEFGLSQIRELALGLRGLDPGQLEMKTVPGVDQHLSGVWYVVADEPAANLLYSAFRTGAILEPAPPPPPPPPVPETLPIEQVQPISVRNGVGTEGLATAAGSLLEDKGFRIAAISNSAELGVAQTIVLFPQGQRLGAQTVAKALGTSRVEEGAVDRVTLLVGADFSQQIPGTQGLAPDVSGQTEMPPAFAGTLATNPAC